jgi:hypothetical protein
MIRNVAFVIMLAAVSLAATPSRAQQLIESYTAFLSEADHFNSNGQRLTSAAAIIRQDRANYYRFDRGDPEDESDRFFRSIEIARRWSVDELHRASSRASSTEPRSFASTSIATAVGRTSWSRC